MGRNNPGIEMEVDNLFWEIRSFLEGHRNPELVLKYQRYFVEGYDAYGVDQQLIDTQRSAWFKDHQQSMGYGGFFDLCDRLVAGGKFEEVFLAYWFMRQFKELRTAAGFNRLAAWLENGICNWAMVDSFCLDMAAPFLQENIIEAQTLAGWQNSSSKWMRRALPVTLIKPVKNGLPPETALDLISPLMGDSEKVVHQGLGWFLREAWKQHPEVIENFLAVWKNTCARLIVQYATEKMTPAQKERFRRGRKAAPR